MHNRDDEFSIKLRNITKKFGETTALNSVSFDVHKGECVALLGPNGAGKTTLIEIITGLVEPDAGEVEINGLSYTRDRLTIQETIGVQQQETSLYRRYTVQETLELFGSFYRETISTNRLLHQLNLEEIRNRKLEHLSGGEKHGVFRLRPCQQPEAAHFGRTDCRPRSPCAADHVGTYRTGQGKWADRSCHNPLHGRSSISRRSSRNR